MGPPWRAPASTAPSGCSNDHTSAPAPSAATTTPPPEEADDHTTVFASERITDEDWTEVPNGSVFSTAADATRHLESLDA